MSLKNCYLSPVMSVCADCAQSPLIGFCYWLCGSVPVIELIYCNETCYCLDF